MDLFCPKEVTAGATGFRRESDFRQSPNENEEEEMRKGLIVLVAAVVLCCTISLSAQSASEGKTRLGLGLVVFDRSILNLVGSLMGASGLDDINSGAIMGAILPPSHINFPIIMGTMKLEPELGLFRQSNSVEDEDGKTTQSFTAPRLGTGVFLLKHLPKTDIYYGGRIGIVKVSEKEEYDPDTGTSHESSTSQTNLYFGPCLGGEYFISNHFSFGGEAQLLLTKYGNPKTEIDPEPPGYDNEDETETKSSLMDTRYLFICRWYLN
jgi:hypothetical protein